MLTIILFVATAQAQSGGGAIPSSVTPLPAIPKKLTLAQAENLLLQRNLTVAASKYQIEASRAARLIASFKPNPTITLGAEQFPIYSNISGSYPRFFSTNSDAGAQPTYTFRVDKVIERGGKRELRIEQADFQIKSAEAQMLDAVRTQMLQLRQAFTNATLAHENLILAQETEQQYLQTERLTAVKVENGDLPGLELYRARAGKLQYQQAVLQARNSYEQATRDVLNLLGARVEEILPASSDTAQATGVDQFKNVSQSDADSIASIKSAPIEIVGTLSERAVLQTVAELRAIALAERPDVIAARNNLEAAERGLKLARAQRARDLDIASEYQRVGQDSSVGVVVQFPIFVYNNQQAAIGQAEAQRRVAEAQLRQAEIQAATDVEKAYQAYLAARRALDLYNTENLAQTEKLRSIAAFSYKEGAVSLFELVDAQRTYNQAISAYNQARADYQNSLWQLEAAIGRPLP
jgi:cobalt-zinc-cadmium efflux system outer membrane protein